MKKTAILLVLAMVILTTSVFGHGMFLKLESDGVLKVEYDGGQAVPNADVIVYDASGGVIAEGRTDDNGLFEFDPSLDVAKAEASDGMGHAASYTPGETQKSIPKLPVVIGVFVVIGVIFYLYSKKKKA